MTATEVTLRLGDFIIDSSIFVTTPVVTFKTGARYSRSVR